MLDNANIPGVIQEGSTFWLVFYSRSGYIPRSKKVRSQPSIDAVEPTGVELRVHMVWQRMIAVGQSLSEVAATKVCQWSGSNQSLSEVAAHDKSVGNGST